MSKLLLIVFLLFSIGAAAQSATYFGRDLVAAPATESSIRADFVNSQKALLCENCDDSLSGKVQWLDEGPDLVVKAFARMQNGPKFCFRDIIFSFDLVFTNREGLSRLELRNIQYNLLQAGTSACTGSGTLEALRSSDCCKTYSNIDAYFEQYFNKIYLRYKKALKAGSR